ncbi:hypothetical protein IB286_12910 [Spongiibacter sp. KMU-158]|uniref:Secreted protein n=1 Tax=Spongiibacter pelagi TaxID=2760804 RepID=A0A927C257_9GAMM|nr:hypothetical protein [Spongiibacter pelagi]MBD2859903.1 hypothetical protein [Spongiibacter pelagi]
MSRFCLFLAASSFAVLAFAESAEDELPVVKWSPSARAESISPFDGMSCEQLLRARPQNEAEKIDLRERNQRCLGQYQRFLPQQSKAINGARP